MQQWRSHTQLFGIRNFDARQTRTAISNCSAFSFCDLFYFFSTLRVLRPLDGNSIGITRQVAPLGALHFIGTSEQQIAQKRVERCSSRPSSKKTAGVVSSLPLVRPFIIMDGDAIYILLFRVLWCEIAGLSDDKCNSIIIIAVGRVASAARRRPAPQELPWRDFQRHRRPPSPRSLPTVFRPAATCGEHAD
jgi:hypothetical protein